MERQQITSVLADLVRDTFGHEDALTSDVRTRDIEGWDSLGTMQIVMAVEDEFAIDIPIGLIPELDTIGKIVEFIHQEARSYPDENRTT